MTKLLTDPLALISKIPLGVTFRWAAMLALIWGYSGQYIKGYAGEVLKQQLTEIGLSPEAFAVIQKKVEEIDRQTDMNSTDAIKLQADIASLLFAQKGQKEDTDEIKQQVNKLVEVLINRKASNP